MSPREKFYRLIVEMRDMIYSQKSGDKVSAAHLADLSAKLYKIQVAAYEFGDMRYQEALLDARAIIAHPNHKQGDAKLLADLGVSLG